jgi:hypothetical protein
MAPGVKFDALAHATDDGSSTPGVSKADRRRRRSVLVSETKDEWEAESLLLYAQRKSRFLTDFNAEEITSLATFVRRALDCVRRLHLRVFPLYNDDVHATSPIVSASAPARCDR